MRLSAITGLMAVFLALQVTPLVTASHAEEKYKDRPKDRPDNEGYKKPPADRPQPPHPPAYKPPDNPQPPPPPPSKEHPEKKPPEPRDQPDPYDPPVTGGWPVHQPCPPPSCPPPFPVCPIEAPMSDPPYVPIEIPMDLNSILFRSVRLMRIEGFAGEVIVAWNGRIQFGAAFDAGGYYDIGSMTEAFTAWAVYRLVESNRLELGTTLGQLFADAPPDKRGITIEQLLGHTSGLANTHAADGESDRNAAVGRLLAQPLALPPGTSFVRSDDNYVLLAAAIEVVSGRSYERYMLESGAVSPDMTSTVFWAERGAGADWGKRGSGGVLSTARDLLGWASRFADKTDHIADEIMRPRQWTDDGVGIGYGWSSTTEHDGPIRWAQGTSNSDDNAMVVVYPTNLTLVVTSNRYHGDVPWSERVANVLEPHLRGYSPGRIEPLISSSAPR